ncbi:MAG: hypothetical protein RIR66_130 [Actinomycetota bacterium]
MSETIFEAQLEVAMQLAHNVAPPTKLISLPIGQANGYVLADEITSATDLPPFNASKVDGYAINGHWPWKLVGENLAGSVSQVSLEAGTCVYVATGAVIPSGAIAVIKQEDCVVSESEVRTKKDSFEVGAGDNIRSQGYEAKSGELLINSGTALTPALLGLIAACGLTEVTVYQKPTVEVLILGDELIHTGNSGNGKVRDSIGPQISGWLNHFGAHLLAIKYVADTLDEHISAINSSNADLVITTGGTAAGPADHLHNAISQCGGSVLVDAVLVRPGYHQLIAELPNKFLIGLPGNPQSAVIGLITLVSNFIAGATNKSRVNFGTRIMATEVSAPVNEHRFVLSREIKSLTKVGHIEPVEHLDSSMLRGFVDAEGYAVIEPGGATSGSIVSWIPLPA